MNEQPRRPLGPQPWDVVRNKLDQSLPFANMRDTPYYRDCIWEQFSAGEYKRRYDSLRAKMREHKLDAVVVPVGGGGLIAGVSVAVKSRRPSVRIIGVQAIEHHRKRVVLLHQSGLHRITGMFDSSVHTLRDYVEFERETPLGTRLRVKARLASTQDRYVIYQEIKS